MGEGDQLGARRQQLVQHIVLQRAGLAIDRPFADHDPEFLQPPPGADIGLVILLGHDDLVAGLEARPQCLRHQIDVHGGGGAEHDLVMIGVDEFRHQVLAVRDPLGGEARGREVRVRLHLGLGHVFADAVDHLARHIGAAGILHEHPPIGERRELVAHIGGVEGHGGQRCILAERLETPVNVARKCETRASPASSTARLLA
jgi:hypothetical protein